MSSGSTEEGFKAISAAYRQLSRENGELRKEKEQLLRNNRQLAAEADERVRQISLIQKNLIDIGARLEETSRHLLGQQEIISALRTDVETLLHQRDELNKANEHLVAENEALLADNAALQSRVYAEVTP